MYDINHNQPTTQIITHISTYLHRAQEIYEEHEIFNNELNDGFLAPKG